MNVNIVNQTTSERTGQTRLRRPQLNMYNACEEEEKSAAGNDEEEEREKNW